MIFESVSTIPKTFLQAQYIVTIVHYTINTIYTVYILYYSTLYYIYCTIYTYYSHDKRCKSKCHLYSCKNLGYNLVHATNPAIVRDKYE